MISCFDFKFNSIFGFIYILLLMDYNILAWISYIEYDPSGNSNSSFHVGDDTFNVLFLYNLFMFFDV